MAALDGLRQRVVHNQLAARAVHDADAFLHNRQRGLVDQPLGLRRQPHVQRKKVRLRKDLVDGHQRHIVLTRDHRSHKRVIAQQVHPEGLRAPRNLQPDAPQPDDAQRLAAQLRALQRLLLPLAVVHRRVGARDAAAHRDHQPQRQLGHGDGVGSGRVHHHDAAPRGLRCVDVVHAHARAPDDAQLRSGLQQLGVRLHRGAHNQRIGVSQLGGQAARGNLVGGHDVPAGFFLQDGEGGGRDFFCENDLQDSSRARYACAFQCSCWRFRSRTACPPLPPVSRKNRINKDLAVEPRIDRLQIYENTGLNL